jgi:hypothetical protein
MAAMYVRIARFEGGDPAAMDDSIARVRAHLESSPPPGASRILMLVDRETGTSLGVTFFDGEDALRAGDAAMSSASRPHAGGSRASVEIYDVAVDVEP